MPKPTLSAADFQTLKKNGTSNGTITGTNFGQDDTVSITSSNGKKTWGGTIGTNSSGDTWNASVENIQWNQNATGTADTVNLVVTSGGQTSNPIPVTTDIP